MTETMLVGKSVCENLLEKSSNENNSNLPDAAAEFNDFLTTSTHLTEKCFSYINRQFLDSKLYRILFHTTQSLHLVCALLASSIAYALYAPRSSSSFVTFLYLSAVSLHSGAQFWMTFVSGLSLYFALPRHHFGAVQRVLFPRYFLFNAGTSFITLTLFLHARRHDVMWSLEIVFQVYVLTSCFLVESLIRIYLTPPLLKLMREKNDLEAAAGSGNEIGRYNLGTLAICPKYTTIHKEFRKVHMKVAFGNIYTLACTTFHLYYLSTKIVT